MKKIGLIINPIAGMGGSVGLKGTDNAAAEALRRGAVPRAGERAEAALSELLAIKEELVLYTCRGAMGGDLAEELGFRTVMKPGARDGRETVPSMDAGPGAESRPEAGADGSAARDLQSKTGAVGLAGGLRPEIDAAESVPGVLPDTSAFDTKSLASWLLSEHVDLILFAGGDGTARDVYEAVELNAACVGIPAGVKIHSPVYAKNPRSAGRLALLWLTGKISMLQEEEVLDIDEEQYRRENISTRLYGYLNIPKERTFTQNRKAPTPLSDAAAIESIACEVVRQMEPDTYYIIGAGTTTRGVMDVLGLKNTLIGVDVIRNKELVANDLGGRELLSLIKGKRAKLVVTITGGQGYLFGRGNQQLTPEVIREVGRENIIIIATKTKLAALSGQPLLVDTYDEELNHSLCGYYRVINAWGEAIVCRVADD